MLLRGLCLSGWHVAAPCLPVFCCGYASTVTFNVVVYNSFYTFVVCWLSSKGPAPQSRPAVLLQTSCADFLEALQCTAMHVSFRSDCRGVGIFWMQQHAFGNASASIVQRIARPAAAFCGGGGWLGSPFGHSGGALLFASWGCMRRRVGSLLRQLLGWWRRCRARSLPHLSACLAAAAVTIVVTSVVMLSWWSWADTANPGPVWVQLLALRGKANASRLSNCPCFCTSHRQCMLHSSLGAGLFVVYATWWVSMLPPQ